MEWSSAVTLLSDFSEATKIANEIFSAFSKKISHSLRVYTKTINDVNMQFFPVNFNLFLNQIKITGWSCFEACGKRSRFLVNFALAVLAFVSVVYVELGAQLKKFSAFLSVTVL